MDIYEEHLDEAAFLWLQWERALLSPAHDLRETVELEERLLAHLDGLVLGGAPVARALLRPALESEEPPRISSALWALLAEPTDLELTELVTLLKTLPGELLGAAQRALELSGREGIGEALLPLLKETDASLQALALEVFASRAEVPKGSVVEWLQHADARVVVAALRGMHHRPQELDPRMLSSLLVEKRPGIAEAAIEAGLVAGLRTAWDECRKVVGGRVGIGRLPMALLALSGDDRDIQSLLECVGRAELRADALWALGFSGQIGAAEACLELMADESLAGEAFSAITGLRLEEPYVAPRQDEEESLPPLEEDLAEDLEHRPESELRMPKREAVAAWWQDARKEFTRGTRYLRGRVFSIEGLLEELEQGPMRRRHVHALELAIRSRGACMLQTRAFSDRQRAGLEQARAMKTRLTASPLSQLFGR